MRTVFLLQSGEFMSGANITLVCETREAARKYAETWIRIIDDEFKEADVSDRHDGITDRWVAVGGDWIEIREEDVKQ